MLTGWVSQQRAEVSCTDFRHQCADFLVGRAFACKVKQYSRIGIGRHEAHGNRLAAVDTRAGQRHSRLNCRLIIVQNDPRVPPTLLPALVRLASHV